MVELALPDLPWLFTPAAPDGSKLRPWICLVVVAEGDGVALDVPRALAVLQLTIRRPSSPTDTYRCVGARAGDRRQPRAMPEGGARRRRGCASRPPGGAAHARADRGYIACIVPIGRRERRLGPSVDERISRRPGTRTRQDPKLVCYHFRFRTGPGGDFKSLARRSCRGKPLDAGKRSVDISEPGFGLNAAPASLTSKAPCARKM